MGLISNGTTVFDAGAMASGFGGSMTFIKKLTASSSASLSFVDGSSDVVLDNTYKEYVFIFKDIHPATNGVTFTFQVSTDSGSSYGVSTTSTYFNAYHSESGANALNYEAIADIANATSEVPIIREDKLSSDNDHCGVGIMRLFNPASTTFVKHYIVRTQANHEAEYSMDSYIGGFINSTSAVDAIRFKVSSGNIDSGTISLYGIS